MPTSPRSFSNVVGFDDSPFDLENQGDGRVIGAVCVRTNVDSELSTTVRRDGSNATDQLIDSITASLSRRTSAQSSRHRARRLHRRRSRTHV